MEFRITEADLAKEKKDILAFWRENFPNWPEKKFPWFYQGNPYRPAVCCTIRETETDSLIGSAAVFPRRFIVQGEVCIGGINGDLAVHKSHRSLGPALSLQKAIRSASKGKGVDFVYGYPNKKAEPVLKRIGYRFIGSGTKLVRVMRSHKKVKKYIKVPLVSHLAGGVLDVFAKMTSRESRYRNSGEFTTENLSSFDARFDGLWAKASQRYPILAERTQSTLNWRFTQCPYRDYRIFALIRRSSGEIAGYIAYDISDRNVRIADLLAEDMDRALEVLLSEFLLAKRKENIDRVTINYFGNEEFIKKLKEFNFIIRDTSGCVILHVDPGHAFASVLADPNNWYLMDGDNDV